MSLSLKNSVLKSAAATFLVAGLGVQPAAAIQCRGPNQFVSGNWIGTPYCKDNYLAEVARNSYGIPVSNHAVRQNPSVKEEVCRVVGTDIRVLDACAGFQSYGGRDRF